MRDSPANRAKSLSVIGRSAIIVVSLLAGCGPGPTAQTPPAETRQADQPSRSVKPRERKIAEVEITPDPVQAATPVQPKLDEKPQPVYRPDDRRARRDDQKLFEAGVRSYESSHLKLYTDISDDAARILPGLVDQLYKALEAYFGPMPADRAGTAFQMTGYLMKDMALFRDLGLVPDDVIFEHGKHLANEFWMRDQTFDYYRRHLMFHEATHCFMTYLPDVQAPVWYLEGMAELFGTHHLDDQNQATFRVMPDSQVDFAGFGRIETIRDDVTWNTSPSIPTILNLQIADFRTLSHYSWSWGLCAFLDGTPRYHERFQKLGRSTQGGEFAREFRRLFEPDRRDLETEWASFTKHIQEGYDLTRASIDFVAGEPLPNAAQGKTVAVMSDRGWQSSRIRLEQGRTYRITANGKFSLGERPRPWVSEPQGITFRYAEGQPIGMLLGCVRQEAPGDAKSESMLQSFAIGKQRDFQAQATGTLYLRLNDAWNSLQDNRGQIEVTIREVQPADGP